MSCLPDFFDCAPDSPTLLGFCCPRGTQCLWFAANTTLLCCPEGSSCERLEIVPCDLNEYNPEEVPDAPIKTAASDVELERCGDKCCPHGYRCNEGQQCHKLSAQDVAPGEEAEEEEAPIDENEGPSTSSKVASPATSTTPSSEDATTSITDGENNTPSDDNALRIGVPVGLTLLFLVVLGLLIFIICRRRRYSGGSRPRSWTRSQQRFDKAELDAGSECEVAVPAPVKQVWEMEDARAPVELAATPLPMSRTFGMGA